MNLNKLNTQEQDEMLELLEEFERTEIAPKFEAWRNPATYKIAYGGRGAGAKSWSSVSLLCQKAEEKRLRIACLREVQKSLEESVYSLVCDTISRLGYTDWKITDEYIDNKANGSHIIFRGLKDLRAARQIKSLDSFDIFFVEEAATISHESWSILMPTLRKKGSELWAVFNREEELDPVYERFVVNERDDSIILELEPGPIDNPWWHETTLPAQMEEDFKYDPDEAEHIWYGLPRKQGFKAAISRARIRQAMDRSLKAEGGIVVGCDPADYGDDKTEIYIRHGLKIIEHRTISKMDGVYIANEIGSMINYDPSIKINIDTTGIGVSLRDQLRVLGLKVNAINFSQSPMDKDKYPDIITEMYFEFPIDEIDIPNDPQLMRELSGRQYSYDNSNRRKIESKSNYKKRCNKSPDKADAILLCYYKGKGQEIPKEAQSAMASRHRRGR